MQPSPHRDAVSLEDDDARDRLMGRQPPARRLTSPPEDEARLVASSRAGDQAAFARLVERFGKPVISLCYASTLNPSDAEDLAQDVFLAAWRGLPHFRGESAFSTWLFVLARNLCIDRARRAAARPKLADDPDIPELAADCYDHAVNQTAQSILAEVARLSPRLRDTLVLRDLQGLSYEEIASLLDVPVGTVRSRLAAARATITAKVDQ